MRLIAHHRYFRGLCILYLLIWAALAIAPNDRADWALENLLVLLFGAVLVGGYRRLTFSRVSYTLIFLFLCLHAVGAHYTYAEVPYDRWWAALTGRTFYDMVGWTRNNFDRVVHFCYGLLLAYPIREVFLRVANVRGFWGYFLPLDVTASTSMVFELLEWGVAMVVAPDLGNAYLGTQGDQWDAHKDMALATLGAAIAMTVTAAINLRMQRDFAREWNESLTVKRKMPLGENAFDEPHPQPNRSTPLP
jgi:putative membrane protein